MKKNSPTHIEVVLHLADVSKRIVTEVLIILKDVLLYVMKIS